MRGDPTWWPEALERERTGRKLRRARNVIRKVERVGTTGQGAVIMERYRKAKALVLAQKLSED